MSERFDNASDDIKEKFLDVYKQKTFQFDIGFKFIDDAKLKKVIEIKKIPDLYSFILEKEVLVLINEETFNKLDEDSQNILIEQEIDKISLNIETGKITMNKPDIVTFSPLISKHGIDKVAKANQVEDLTVEQQEEMNQEFR